MERIKINILHDNDVSGKGDVLTRGIPFADGELKNGESIMVVLRVRLRLYGLELRISCR